MSKSRTSFILTALFFILGSNSVSAQYVNVHTHNGVRFAELAGTNGVLLTAPSSGITTGLKTQNTFDNGFDSPAGFNWVLKFTASGRVFKDVSFANTQVGYIVTELGAVYKTTNGGDNWTQKMNLGFPFYWYGVSALSSDTVVISGFNNQGSINTGVVRWSLNGGDNWSTDIILRIPSGVGWLDKVHFFNQNTGIVMASFSGGVHYTTTGGKDTTAWHYVQVNTDLAWFAGNIDAQASGRVYATGIHLARSTNFGLNWVSGPSADNVFDGGVDFLDNNNLFGWTGGGQISNPVSGWTHRTTDGGASWSGRQFTFPYPIRAVKFFNDTLGLAVGGNLFQELGGIYSTSNGGLNWNLDINTSAEMFSVEWERISPDSIDVWCAGSTGGTTGYTGRLYKARVYLVTGIANNSNEVPERFQLYQNYPNPFNPVTKIKFSLPLPSEGGELEVRLVIYDVLGREVAVLIPPLRGGQEGLQPGTYEVTFDASRYSSGIYFYRLVWGEYSSETRKMALVK